MNNQDTASEADNPPHPLAPDSGIPTPSTQSKRPSDASKRPSTASKRPSDESPTPPRLVPTQKKMSGSAVSEGRLSYGGQSDFTINEKRLSVGSISLESLPFGGRGTLKSRDSPERQLRRSMSKDVATLAHDQRKKSMTAMLEHTQNNFSPENAPLREESLNAAESYGPIPAMDRRRSLTNAKLERDKVSIDNEKAAEQMINQVIDSMENGTKDDLLVRADTSGRGIKFWNPALMKFLPVKQIARISTQVSSRFSVMINAPATATIPAKNIRRGVALRTSRKGFFQFNRKEPESRFPRKLSHPGMAIILSHMRTMKMRDLVDSLATPKIQQKTLLC